MNQVNSMQGTIERLARRYGLWVILGLMVLESILEWRRQQR